LNSADAALGQHASMQKRIARPIGEFNEAKSLFGAEPFDDPADRWPRRGLEPGLGEPGSGAECTRLRVGGISVELAMPQVTEVLISLWLPNLRVVLGSSGERQRCPLVWLTEVESYRSFSRGQQILRPSFGSFADANSTIRSNATGAVDAVGTSNMSVDWGGLRTTAVPLGPVHPAR